MINKVLPLRNAARLSKFGQFSVKNAVKLISLYIRPHLEYAVAVWSPWLKKDIAILEAPQRRATKLIKGFSHLSYESRLKSLNLFSVNYRRLRGDMILTYKILSNPNHPCKYLLTPSSLTHLRGNSKKLKHTLSSRLQTLFFLCACLQNLEYFT